MTSLPIGVSASGKFGCFPIISVTAVYLTVLGGRVLYGEIISILKRGDIAVGILALVVIR